MLKLVDESMMRDRYLLSFIISPQVITNYNGTNSTFKREKLSNLPK